MRKSIIGLIRGSQRGFTLIELLAVMAVIGVLAGIVTTSVSGTGETSNVAQAKSDGGTMQSSAGTFFTDQEAAEVLTQKSVTVTADIASSIVIDSTTGAVTSTAYDSGATASAVTQEKSSRWPEVYLTENSDTFGTAADALACDASSYCNEFPTTGLNADGVVIKVSVADSDKAAIKRSDLLTKYTAIDFAKLTDPLNGYAPATPDSAELTAEVNVGSKTINVHNYLWLFRKGTTSGGSGENDSRSVAVFKLVSVKVAGVARPANDTVTLSYEQIF